jgi:hypothetical protein
LRTHRQPALSAPTGRHFERSLETVGALLLSASGLDLPHPPGVFLPLCLSPALRRQVLGPDVLQWLQPGSQEFHRVGSLDEEGLHLVAGQISLAFRGSLEPINDIELGDAPPRCIH